MQLNSKQYQFYFWQRLNTAISIPREVASDKEVSMYPSEASAIAENSFNEKVVLGGCLRKSWFRNKLQRAQRNKDHQTTVVDAIVGKDFSVKDLWKFSVSNGAEAQITQMCKTANIWHDNSFKFKWHILIDEKYKSALISGEVDIIVKDDDGNLIGIEVKSISGYKGQRQVFGVKSKARGHWIQQPEPKDNQLLQAILYAHYFCLEIKTMKYFKLVYISREDGSHIEFDIDLVPEGDRHRVYVNGKPYTYKLYSEDLIDRYLDLHKAVIDDELPARDYELQYTVDHLKTLYARNALSKEHTALAEKEKWAKIKKGDWQCSYCPFKDMCYNDKLLPIDYTGKVISPDQIFLTDPEEESD